MERTKFQQKISYLDSKGTMRTRIKTWFVNPDDEEDWEIEPAGQLPVHEVPMMKARKKPGPKKGSKNRPTTLRNRKTREPTKRVDNEHIRTTS
jgi:hypothetical protein